MMHGHIGIAGVSPEGAAEFYRVLSQVARTSRAPGAAPRVTMHSEPLGDYLDAIRKDDWLAVGRMLRRSADVVAAAGATCCMTPDNVVQHGVQLAEVGSPIPWLTMPELVGEAVAQDRRGRVGILGTKKVCFSSTYQVQLGLRGIRVTPPPEGEAGALDEIIYGELLYGSVRPESVARVQEIMAGLGQQGCEAVILASSELSLIVDERLSPLPVYDSNILLARAALTT